MPAGSETRTDEITQSEPEHLPEVAVCESCPGKSVFLESGNTDGWIASDVTVGVTR